LLAATPARPPTLAEVAREVNVEPVALARAFKREFGCSMANLSRRLRLQNAVRALVESDRPISVIAAEHGFYDQSHFGRHCRREFGLAPRAVRRAGHVPVRTSPFESS
jgi:transcriptional regulator GlxA family with amidase domain